ncbi:hypothetical protein CPB84DRAFT_936297 [Gymnopilus junonius]|uniref:Uncharacterized protein n=1 Tax=Gymnopilus junonius TaxID=109634 RepID=A0A9P5P271_GYMJU|nr:hypothetical protein CPB84DRAFT_936297 [Gymnopilus junonius]
MRSLFSCSLLFLAASLSAVKAAAIDEQTQCFAEICGEPEYARLFGREAEAAAAAATPCPTVHADKELTNGERLARGLPLKPPTRRSKLHVARAAQASPVPTVTYTGYIQVRSGADSLGYITAVGSASGLLKYTTDPTQAILVSISLPVGVTSASQADLTMLNANGPLLGLVQGRDDANANLGTGSFNYLYITGIALPGTDAGATPAILSNQYSSSTNLARSAESSVVRLPKSILPQTIHNANQNSISIFYYYHYSKVERQRQYRGDGIQWINSDGSSPSVTAFEQGGFLYVGGDVPAFAARYPSPIVTVFFHFVPAIVPV